MKKIIILSGGFDPVHIGHIRMFKEASQLGYVIVGLNSDEWLIRKKGKNFMSEYERQEVLESIKYIDEVIKFDDTDNTACILIEKVKLTYPDTKLYFGNGGDRTNDSTPEIEYCILNNIELIWNLGGGKIQSSSKLLKKW